MKDSSCVSVSSTQKNIQHADDSVVYRGNTVEAHFYPIEIVPDGQKDSVLNMVKEAVTHQILAACLGVTWFYLVLSIYFTSSRAIKSIPCYYY